MICPATTHIINKDLKPTVLIYNSFLIGPNAGRNAKAVGDDLGKKPVGVIIDVDVADVCSLCMQGWMRTNVWDVCGKNWSCAIYIYNLSFFE